MDDLRVKADLAEIVVDDLLRAAPALAVQEAVAAGQLLQFELDETPVRRSIYMARRRKSSMSSPARTFAELVRKQAKASV